MVFGSKSIVSAAALLFVASGASASVSDVCFQVRATAEIDGVQQTATFQALYDDMYYDEASQTWGWDLQSPLELRSSEGVVIATLNEGSVRVIQDPVVSVNFAVSSGAVMTAFDITAAQLSFASLASATGYATAAFTANDNNFDGGVTVSPLGAFPNNALYVATYNNVINPLDGTNFGGGLLINGPYSNPFITGDSGTVPLQAIPGTVSNMQAGFQFSLSSGDQASGTSTFEIVPAPGTLALLGLGGLFASRRRR